jgi:hypothetical protein
VTQLEAGPRKCARCGASNRLLYSVRLGAKDWDALPANQFAYEYVCGICLGDPDWPKRDHAA